MINKINSDVIFKKSNQLSSDNIGIIALFLALIALSFAAIFIKLCEQEISPNGTVFNRLWIATVIFAIGMLVKQQTLKEDTIKIFPDTKKDLLLLIIVGIVSTTSVMFWALSLTETTVANSTLLRNLCPIFTTLGGWLFLNQRFSKHFIIGMAIAILGTIALCWNDLQIGVENLWGDGIALLAALFYSINLLILEKLRANYPSTTLLLWRCMVGAIYLLPIVLINRDSIFPHTWQGWAMVIGFAFVCQVVGQGLLVYCLKQFSSSFVAVFLLCEPAITAALAWLIFGESLGIVNGVAFVLTLGGIYLTKLG